MEKIMKKIYVMPTVKMLAAKAEPICAVSTGTSDVFANDTFFDDEEDAFVALPKAKDVWAE